MLAISSDLLVVPVQLSQGQVLNAVVLKLKVTPLDSVIPGLPFLCPVRDRMMLSQLGSQPVSGCVQHNMIHCYGKCSFRGLHYSLFRRPVRNSQSGNTQPHERSKASFKNDFCLITAPPQ